MISLSWLTVVSRLLMFSIWDVSNLLRLEIMSLMKLVSCLLLGGMVNLDDEMNSSMMGMLMMRGA